jgi:hypothetical protein
MCGQEIHRLPVFGDALNFTEDHKWSGVMHGQFHGIPRAATITTVGSSEMRVLAVGIVQWAAHGKAPQHVLPWRMVEHGIAVGELQCTMPLLVVKDRARDTPRVAVVGRNNGINAAHVSLARDAFLIRHDEVLLFPQSDARLSKQGSAQLLVGGADDAHVTDIAGGGGGGDLVFGVQRWKRRE